MHTIDIDSIKLQKSNSASLIFKDKFNEYNFNISKSTLYKRFITNHETVSIPVEILDDPIELLLLKFKSSVSPILTEENQTECVILPLYSIVNGEKVVCPKSGLNTWNAQGRLRHPDELYIPISAKTRKISEGFFPPRSTEFTLILPDKTYIRTNICQADGKALMSNPNKALGHWLLRTVLQLKERELLTYDHLNDLGINSVRIDKIDQTTYTINLIKNSDFEEDNNY